MVSPSRTHEQTMIAIVLFSSLLNFERFAADPAKVDECLEKFKLVTSLEQLKQFLVYSGDQFTEDDIVECLKMKIPLSDLEHLIEQAANGRICGDSIIEKIVTMHPDMSVRMNKDNLLAPMWDKFLKQVLVVCKRSLISKLEHAEKTPEVVVFLKAGSNLAQNFDWLDETQFIKDGEIQLEPDTSAKSLDHFARSVPTSGRIDEILRMRNIPDYQGDSENQPKVDLQITDYQFYLIRKMLNGCAHLNYYRRKLLDPILGLNSLGYDDTQMGLEDKISQYQHIDLWLASTQMCHLLKYLQVLEMNRSEEDLQVRLKAGLTILRANDETDAPHIAKFSIVAIEPFYNYLASVNSDKFTEFEGDLEQTICYRDDSYETNKEKSLNESRKLMAEAVLSEKFLKVMANLIKYSKEQFVYVPGSEV